MRVFCILFIFGLAVTILPGCATTDSEMPWNTPQTWEGSMSVPGLSGEQ